MPVRRDLLYAGILDALLFDQQSDLLAESIILLREPDSGVPAIGSPASGECEGEVGERDRVENGGSDVFRPTFRQREPCGLFRIEHGALGKI